MDYRSLSEKIVATWQQDTAAQYGVPLPITEIGFKEGYAVICFDGLKVNKEFTDREGKIITNLTMHFPIKGKLNHRNLH
jgi:hypothetical protein